MARPRPADPEDVTVHVPIAWPKRGGRKRVMTVAGSAPAATPRHVDDALIKALGRAHRWQRLLDSGAYDSIKALADAEKIDKSYLCKVLRLATLSPSITETILDGRQPDALEFRRLLKPFPNEWEQQVATLTVA
jgi:hypothetical protein